MSSFRVHPVTPVDWPALPGLFEAYPHKVAQRVAQRLDETRLRDFYATGLRRACEAGHPHWLVEQAAWPIALAGMAPDAWHSEIYEMPMAKVQPWLNTLAPEAGALLLDAAEAHAAAAGLAHLSLRLDGADFPNLQLLCAHGWRLVDVSLKFSRAFGSAGAALARRGGEGCPGGPGAPWRIDHAGPVDADWIAQLAGQTHAGTHYFNDPALPAERTRLLFSRWVERCLTRLAWRVYALRDGGGAGRGFVTYLRNPGFARAVGRNPLILDFVLIDPAVRGGGLGPWFIEQTLALAAAEAVSAAQSDPAAAPFDYCELRTSAHNLAAVMTYEKLGFRCCASDFVMHRQR